MKLGDVLLWSEVVSELEKIGRGIVAKKVGGEKVRIHSFSPINVKTVEGIDVFRKNIAGAKALLGDDGVVHFPESVPRIEEGGRISF